MDELSFFLAPFCMCLILIGIHNYLGLHVLQRGVIFVDLSLAQVASLGATFGILLHYEKDSIYSYFISLTFTFLAAILFSLGKKVEDKFPQEVLIGIVYALSSALIILIASQLSHGAEQIKDILVGRILWVTWDDVFKTAMIYTPLSIIHYVYRKQFLQSSFNKSKSNLKWDFLFYALFGIVITSSVKYSGVLLVFAFLIVPPLVSTFTYKTIKSRLAMGWLLGILMSVVGLYLSYKLDLPAGAVLVAVFSCTALITLPFLLLTKGSS